MPTLNPIVDSLVRQAIWDSRTVVRDVVQLLQTTTQTLPQAAPDPFVIAHERMMRISLDLIARNDADRLSKHYQSLLVQALRNEASLPIGANVRRCVTALVAAQPSLQVPFTRVHWDMIDSACAAIETECQDLLSSIWESINRLEEVGTSQYRLRPSSFVAAWHMAWLSFDAALSDRNLILRWLEPCFGIAMKTAYTVYAEFCSRSGGRQSAVHPVQLHDFVPTVPLAGPFDF